MRQFLLWLARSIFLPRDDPFRRIRSRLVEAERSVRKSDQWEGMARSFDETGLRHLARRCRAIADLYRRRAGVISRSRSSRAA